MQHANHRNAQIERAHQAIVEALGKTDDVTVVTSSATTRPDIIRIDYTGEVEADALFDRINSKWHLRPSGCDLDLRQQGGPS